MDPTRDLPPPAATDRRSFLGRAAAVATVAAVWPVGIPSLDRLRLEPTAPGAPRQALTALEWRTLAACAARVLPSEEDAPGATDVNVVGWIDALVADEAIEEDTKARIRGGAAELHRFAKTRGAVEFARLEPGPQDEGVKRFEGDWESQLFLRALIAWTMEALLGDPVHGVNPDETGWRWAHRRPGYPRPQPGWAPKGEGPRPPPPERDR